MGDEHDLAAAEARCKQLEETLKAVEHGPTGEMVTAWEQERCELLGSLEEAEDRILRMQGQVPPPVGCAVPLSCCLPRLREGTSDEVPQIAGVLPAPSAVPCRSRAACPACVLITSDSLTRV